ncbi:MAG: efflux RND transporter periplasmic adaptor subunit, partial [Polyangiaceae bacterium]|nr:efflux RND transporter periplasmic adaptor subunit [Polyangiaceae bacterium]
AHRELEVAERALSAARRASGFFSAAASGRGPGAYRITSPLDGIVADVRATTGATVAPGELLFRVVDVSELWIRARVPEREASGIRADQDASLSLPGLETPIAIDITGDDANASVVSVARTIDPESRTVDVLYGLVRPDERLRVGALVRVHVPVGEPVSGVVVPASAVLDDDGRPLVYVQVEGEAFEERTVRMGARSGAQVVLRSGVREGERIVTHGANVVRLAARAGSAPAHGHVH